MKHDADQIVQQQYDTDNATQFYKIVMGDGGSDIHYGIFEKKTDTTLQASKNTITTLQALLATSGCKLSASTHVLDLGSGNGGTAHKLAQEYGTKVTCVNICESQNEHNRSTVADLGIASLVDVVDGSFEDLDASWDAKFDAVWSQDAYVHSQNKPKVFSECMRVLKPGGYMIFTDIMAGVTASEEAISAFKKRLHADEMYTMPMYEELLQRSGFTLLRTRDFTNHLTTNYRRMIQRVKTERARLDGCSDEYLANYTASLRKNVELLSEGEAQTWGAMVAMKPSSSKDLGAMTVQTAVAAVNGTAVNGTAVNGTAAATSDVLQFRRYVTSKLHNLAVTDKSVFYHGSISVCRKILAAGKIDEFEAVDVVNLRNGARWTTYAIGNDEEGTFSLNGGGARLGELGDECVVMSYGMSKEFAPAQVVYCEGFDNNGKTRNRIKEMFPYVQREE